MELDNKLQESLDGLKAELTTAIETKSKEEVEEKFKAFSEEYKTSLSESAKEAYDKAVEDLQAKFAKEEEGMKAMQDHLDKLDIRMKGVTKSQKQEKGFREQLGELLMENEEKIAKFANKEIKSFDLELKAPGDITTGNVTGTRYGELFNPAIIDRPSRATYMSQLVAPGSIGPGNSFTHMREVGAGEGDPAPTAEGGTKPQFDYDLAENTVQIENIAGWIRVTRKAMRNIPGFVSFLQRRIPDRFQRVLDAQILYGDGATPNLKGILTAGNFVDQTTAVNKPVSQKIIDYLSLFEDTYERLANGIVVRPATYYSMFTEQASGSGEFDLPFGVTLEGGVVRVLGVPVFTTTALNATDIVVGDWANGAQLLTQESMRIEFFEQDGDNVRTNKVTVRVEGDYALPVYGPDYFIRGTTATV